METIGFVSLGTIGGAVARNIQKGGALKGTGYFSRCDRERSRDRARLCGESWTDRTREIGKRKIVVIVTSDPSAKNAETTLLVGGTNYFSGSVWA